ncbi:hypothetical protein [uncultured Chryseobacterium sp.]|uniref:hypothetical protein n=1 Tax=uncultured Chryseobacterium sp. TaxID=259322 RepID=UPI0025FDBAC6|nr:hypothetical protein [uncultured Chryseobacterium sp.]
MKNLTAAFLVAMLCFAQNLRSQNILPPQKVFNLYFDSFVKYNDDSLKELNSYLINFLGKENTHKMSLQESYDEKVNSFTDIFLSNLSPEVSGVCKNEAREYFRVLIGNFKNATYRIKDIKTVPGDQATNQEISEVDYEVNFKVPAVASRINVGDIKKIGAGEMKKYLIDITNDLKKADKIVSTRQKFNMYQVKYGTDTYYWNGGPQEMAWKLNEFYFKNIN